MSTPYETQMSWEQHITLKNVLRAANNYYHHIAADHAQAIKAATPRDSPRMCRPKLLHLTVDTEMARRCPQKAIHVHALPIIEQVYDYDDQLGNPLPAFTFKQQVALPIKSVNAYISRPTPQLPHLIIPKIVIPNLDVPRDVDVDYPISEESSLQSASCSDKSYSSIELITPPPIIVSEGHRGKRKSTTSPTELYRLVQQESYQEKRGRYAV